jgi:hypothetical protein
MKELKEPPPPPPASAVRESATPWRRALPWLPALPKLPRFSPPRPALYPDLDIRRLRALAREQVPRLRLPRWRLRLPRRALPWERLALALLVLELVVLLSQVRLGLSKPFWYDEQWRAYHVSLAGPSFWRQIRQANSPIAGGWVLLEKGAALLLGNLEWALRLPMALGFALAVVFTWLVGRRLLGRVGGLLVAGALAINGPLFAYAPELKPYTVEAMATVGALLLWLWARDPDRGQWRRLAAYTGIGLLAVLATGLIFVLVPLFALDLAAVVPSRRSPVELARLRFRWPSRSGSASPARALGGRLVPDAVAGGIALTHLVWFVLPQSVQLGATYWRAQFVPHGSVGQAWHFAVTQVAGWVPEVVTGTLRPSAAIGWLLGLALLAGTAVAIVLERRLLVLPVTLFGALALEYVAAARWRWPFGFVRVNLFLVPLVYLLAGAGIVRSLALLARFARGRLGGDGGWAWLRQPSASARAVGAALLALALTTTLVVTGCGVVPDSLKQVQATSAQTHEQGWGDGIRELVRQVRQQQEPGSLAVVGGVMGVKGWAYYMWSYAGWEPSLRAEPPIPPARTLLLSSPDQRAMAAFLATHRSARQVEVLLMAGSGAAMARATSEPLSHAGYRLQRSRAVSQTGRLLTWVRA